MKLAGKGISTGKDGARGDQYVELHIKIPKGDSQYQEAAEKLRSVGFNPRA